MIPSAHPRIAWFVAVVWPFILFGVPVEGATSPPVASEVITRALDPELSLTEKNQAMGRLWELPAAERYAALREIAARETGGRRC